MTDESEHTLPAELGGFAIVGTLGEGSIAQVFRARDTLTGREVALKVLRPEMRGEPEVRAHFHREARALMRIEHPNVIGVLDYSGPEAAIPFIAMERLRGATLAALIADRGKLPGPVARALFSQAASGLEAAHRMELIHRDLSLGNIFVEDDGRVVITDFGLVAAVMGQRTSETFITRGTGIVGTPLYFAPEILRGSPASERADIYALGVCMSYALLGRPPFPIEEIGALLAAIIDGQLLSPASERTDVDPELLALCDRCRALSEDARPADAAEVAAALGAEQDVASVVAQWLDASAETRKDIEVRVSAIQAALERNELAHALALSTDGRYRIGARLGAGGMGLVFLAEDPEQQRAVAIKTLFSVDDESRMRFHREARALGRLRHANIVKVYDYSGRDAPLPYLVLERIEGASLAAVLEEQALPERIAIIVAAEITKALIAVHDGDLVHRDLKPDNIMVETSGRLVLIDFGITRGVEGQGLSGTFVSSHTASLGTPAFSSPEQVLQPEILGPASDLFSLGRLIEVMLDPEVCQGIAGSIMGLVNHTAPRLPSTVSPALRALVGELLLRDPQQRPAAREVLSRLEGLIGGSDAHDPTTELRRFLLGDRAEGVNDTSVVTLPGARRRRRGRHWVALGSVVACLTLLVLGARVGLTRTSAEPEIARLEDAILAAPGEITLPVAPPEIDVPATIEPSVPRPEPRRRAEAPASAPVANPPAANASAPKTPVAKAPPPPPALLKFVTKPWAKVLIDGRPYGDTPELRLTELRAGAHMVRFEHPPFQPVEQRVELKAGETRELRVTLVRAE